jgi:uncharacterized protein (DUF427 family)
MSKSPGHAKWPDHQVREVPLDAEVRASVGSEVVAASDDVVEVDEDECPPRFYFPRADVPADRLEPSETTSECPFKGTASYFHLKVGDHRFEDAVWSYEEPYDEHAALRGRLAFWDDKFAELEVAVQGSKVR